MRKFLKELGLKQEKYVVYSDSWSATHLSKNSTFHLRSKHIDVRYNWISDVPESKHCIWRKYIPVRMNQTC